MCKSILFVPGEKKRLKKIQEIRADAFIIDLEDSIKTEKKDKALQDVSEFLKTNSNSNIWIRVNPNRWDLEKKILQTYNIKRIVVPKVEKKTDLEQYKNNFFEVMALIESPLGLINIEEIVSDKDVFGIGFGAEDFCVATGMIKDEKILMPIRQKMVLFGRAYCKEIYDMVDQNYKDIISYEKSVCLSKNLGFSGKMAIHPTQIDIINKIFCSYDKEYLMQVLREYEKSESGFVIIDNRIYEKPHIDKIKNLLK